MLTTQQLRTEFWEQHPEHADMARIRRTKSKGQNAQLADCRMAWCDFVDAMHRSGVISNHVAGNATL